MKPAISNVSNPRNHSKHSSLISHRRHTTPEPGTIKGEKGGEVGQDKAVWEMKQRIISHVNP